MKKKLVAYFSASGITEKWAHDLANAIKADIAEIRPEKRYTDKDLNWENKNSRSSLEMNDEAERPDMDEFDADIANYETIFLCFPIWWYTAPRIMNTFLESSDFSNKEIILVATSDSTGFGSSLESLKKSVSEKTIIKEGVVLKHSNADVELLRFINELEKNISPCGVDCQECEKYPNECRGCFALGGQVWWLGYTDEEVCGLYDCCVLKNRFSNCGKCAKFPCESYKKGDPTKSKEENEKILQMQIDALTKKR